MEFDGTEYNPKHHQENLKPCPFCGKEYHQVTSAMGEWWVSCVECNASADMKASREEAVKAWNTRHEEKDRLHRVMVVGDGHDRSPLIEAINQIGFDGIIIAEGPPPEPIEIKPLNYRLPEPCCHVINRESNAKRCGYSTKRK